MQEEQQKRLMESDENILGALERRRGADIVKNSGRLARVL